MSWHIIEDRSALLYVRGITAEERGHNGCAVRSVVVSERVEPGGPDTVFYSEIEPLPLVMGSAGFVDIGLGQFVPAENIKKVRIGMGGGVYRSGELVPWRTRVYLRRQWLPSVRGPAELRDDIEEARARILAARGARV